MIPSVELPNRKSLRPTHTMTIEIYENRISRAYNCLSNGVLFRMLNAGGHAQLEFVGGGCLDAPEQIPAGSVKRYGKQVAMSQPVIIHRTQEEAEAHAYRVELANQLIDEIRSQ